MLQEKQKEIETEQSALQNKRQALEEQLRELETLPVQKVQAEALLKQYEQQKKQLEEYCVKLGTLSGLEQEQKESLQFSAVLQDRGLKRTYP